MPRLIPNDILDLPQTRYIPRLTEAEEYARAPAYKMAGLDTVRAEDLASPEWYEANKQDEIGTIAGLMETVDYFTGAPVRAGLSEMLDNELSPYAAVKGFAQSFTKPGKSPTGKDIAQKIGISPMPFKEAAGLAGLDPDYYPNISPAGMAGLGIEMAADISPLAAMTLPGGRMFHGSPHYWKKADMSKVGTGEGVQAFGHGLYVTDSPKIAEEYARTLGQTQDIGTIKRKLTKLDPESRTAFEDAFLDISDMGGEVDELGVMNEIRNHYSGHDRGFLSPETKAKLDKNKKELMQTQGTELFYTTEIPKGEYLQWHETLIDDDLNRIFKQLDKDYPKGSMPGIGRSPETPVSYMKEIMQEGLQHKVPNQGAQIYRQLSFQLGGEKQASEFLNRAGFTGIQYPAGTLSGVSDSKAMNYVLFNDKDLTVKEIKNLSTGKVEKVGGGMTLPGGKMFHGTSSKPFKQYEGMTYFTKDPKEAEAFAKNPILGGGRGEYEPRVLTSELPEGKTLNIDDDVMDALMDGDVDETIKEMAKKAKKEGYDYLKFSHPSSYKDGDFEAIVSINPEKVGIKEIKNLSTGKVEKVGGGVPKENVVFHSTTTDKAKEIKDWGLEPQHGDFVKSTEIYQTMDKYDQLGGSEMTFFSEKPDWVTHLVERKIGRAPTLKDIEKHGSIVITPKDERMYKHLGMGEIEDYKGKKVTFEQSDLYEHPDFDSPGLTELPGYVETGDIISKQPFDADELQVLEGKELIKYLKENYPDVLPKK